MRILIIVFFLFSLNELWACSCVEKRTVGFSNLDIEIERSDWIGIGTIVKANRDSYPSIYEVRIRVLYKGSNQVTTIESGLGGGDCGFMFEVGEEYIIYGIKTKEDVITTSSCHRTNKISNSIDYDYLNKVFKDEPGDLGWSESVANFVQSKIGNQIDIMNPPILVGDDYLILSVKDLMGKHPNYYTLMQLSFGSGDLKRMNGVLREQGIKSNIILVVPFHSKVKRGKLIRKLNRVIN